MKRTELLLTGNPRKRIRSCQLVLLELKDAWPYVGAGGMSNQGVSRTALGTAYLRAAHQLLDAPPRILEDRFAVSLLGPAAERRITEDASSYQTPERRALRAHVVLRARFTEDRLAAAMARGVSQYVILGAGFDTFAYRQPAWARQLRIVEVDHLATQGLKRSYLADAAIAIPENVRFAAVDFDRESLRDGLYRNEIARNEPTFFSWLGVTMYLKEDVIDAALRTIAAFPAGSEIVLTFARSRTDAPSPFAQRAADLGEPWLSYFEPDALASKLRATGFSEVEFLSPADAETRYFRDRPRDLPVPAQTNIVSAIR